MVKGFIFFRTGKIPFVIENYRMDLFTDDSLLEIFCKEYNFKENYILQGQCFDIGPHGRKARSIKIIASDLYTYGASRRQF